MKASGGNGGLGVVDDGTGRVAQPAMATIATSRHVSGNVTALR